MAADVRDKLLDAIKKHSNMEDEAIIDAGEHGADAGWPGFTYYTDTIEFYDNNHEEIWELLNQVAEDMGEPHPIALINTFGRVDSVVDDENFKNLMSWFTLEEIGRWLAAAKESQEG